MGLQRTQTLDRRRITPRPETSLHDRPDSVINRVMERSPNIVDRVVAMDECEEVVDAPRADAEGEADPSRTSLNCVPLASDLSIAPTPTRAIEELSYT
jgi:hypothetical protein